LRRVLLAAPVTDVTGHPQAARHGDGLPDPGVPDQVAVVAAAVLLRRDVLLLLRTKVHSSSTWTSVRWRSRIKYAFTAAACSPARRSHAITVSGLTPLARATPRMEPRSTSWAMASTIVSGGVRKR